eukprot:CAMPEP_0175361298 /NCGR_PEP_ID=MMETSP0095-20121207/16488_1 /TAXON_ID=311494 /ORGANISM="Alexandrium monilatum, Strain CCMP3105" /LENGTH=131 /DNA_ID=CAMNT_0016659147 /DNA_START=38 /DNA_END=434 /DNA_ORIENTATION=+
MWLGLAAATIIAPTQAQRLTQMDAVARTNMHALWLCFEDKKAWPRGGPPFLTGDLQTPRNERPLARGHQTPQPRLLLAPHRSGAQCSLQNMFTKLRPLTAGVSCPAGPPAQLHKRSPQKRGRWERQRRPRL